MQLNPLINNFMPVLFLADVISNECQQGERATGSFLERRPLARAQLHGSSLGGRGVPRTVEDFQDCLRQTFRHEIRMLDPHSEALPPRSVLVNLSLSPCLAARKARAAKDV